jgi:hypothetical protein
VFAIAGITAFVLGCGFVIAMFFAPIFSSIPGYATGPALIVVGTMLMTHATEIEWDDLKIAFPSFLTIALMPLTYSIAYGVLAGILANVTLWLFFGVIDMGIAAWRRDGVNTPCTVFSSMFQCWRDAFEDFVPGLKAEWKAVFKNKVGRAWTTSLRARCVCCCPVAAAADAPRADSNHCQQHVDLPTLHSL